MHSNSKLWALCWIFKYLQRYFHLLLETFTSGVLHLRNICVKNMWIHINVQIHVVMKKDWMQFTYLPVDCLFLLLLKREICSGIYENKACESWTTAHMDWGVLIYTFLYDVCQLAEMVGPNKCQPSITVGSKCWANEGPMSKVTLDQRWHSALGQQKNICWANTGPTRPCYLGSGLKWEIWKQRYKQCNNTSPFKKLQNIE